MTCEGMVQSQRLDVAALEAPQFPCRTCHGCAPAFDPQLLAGMQVGLIEHGHGQVSVVPTNRGLRVSQVQGR